MLNDLILRLRALFKRTTVEHEIDEELRFHLERQVESYEKAGIDHSDALRRARLQFGGLDQVKEEYRDALGVRLVDDVRRDLRYTLRSLRATPLFSLAVIATLALGIGANAAVFSMVNSVLLLPLRFSEPARLFLVRAQSQKDGAPTSYSYLDFLDARRGSGSFEGMAAWRGQGANLSGIGEPEYVQTRQASAGLFSVLGVNLALGREFSAEEDRPGAEPAALISYETWQRRFSGEPRVLGARVTLDGKPHVVVGVLPAGFDLFGNVPVYTPLGQYDDISMRGRQFRPGIWAVGRLKTEVTVAEARAELGVLGRQLAEEYPATNRYWTFTIVPLRDGIVGGADRTLFLLAGAVGLLLLIACANVANLFLARSAARSHEFAIRVAIGASRHQIARQILTESVAVSLVGGVVGLLAGSLAVRLIRGGLLTQMPQLTTLSLDTRVLVFTVGASALAGIVFGLVLVLQQEHNALSVVTQGSRSITRGFRRTQAGLVVTQVALAFVLLAGSGLMLRTISRLQSVDMGFDPKNVLTTGVGLSPAVTSDPARIRTAWKEILARVSAIPGVESAAINISLPLQGEESVQYSVGPGGASGDPLPSARVGAPTLDYWKAMRIPLVRGRLFTEQDIASSPLVVIIDELLAANAFPGEDPVGKRLNLQHAGSARVVGVVRHLRYSAPDEDVSGTSKEQVYVPFEQLPDAFLRPLAPGMRLVLRTSVNPGSIQQSLRQAVAGKGLDQPVHHVATMEQIIGGSLAERRLVLQMLGIFGGLALALASVGIAGVVSYTMNRRLREIAIRIALGARPQQVLGLAMGQGMTMVALGVGVGLAAWFALMQIISSWLYKVTPTDPVTLAGVAAMLSAVTLAATYLPAHRSLRVDPVDVLRYQ